MGEQGGQRQGQQMRQENQRQPGHQSEQGGQRQGQQMRQENQRQPGQQSEQGGQRQEQQMRQENNRDEVKLGHRLPNYLMEGTKDDIIPKWNGRTRIVDRDDISKEEID